MGNCSLSTLPLGAPFPLHHPPSTGLLPRCSPPCLQPRVCCHAVALGSAQHPAGGAARAGSGANLFLYLLRIFKMLDFQPKLGVLTRTMSNAIDDLSHFVLLLAVVVGMYVMLGLIVFGPTIEVCQPPAIAASPGPHP